MKSYDLFCVIQDSRLPLDSIDWSSVPSSNDIVQILVSRNLFQEANTLIKKYSWGHELSDFVALAEVHFSSIFL